VYFWHINCVYSLLYKSTFYGDYDNCCCYYYDFLVMCNLEMGENKKKE